MKTMSPIPLTGAQLNILRAANVGINCLYSKPTDIKMLKKLRLIKTVKTKYRLTLAGFLVLMEK